MDLKLKGRRALVTGSSSGIGEAIATMLAAEGAEVVVHGRDAARARAVAARITARGGDARWVIGDLTDAAAARAVCDEVLGGGGLHILVNNAGGRPNGWADSGWFGQGQEQWLASYRLNVTATAGLIDALAPRMIEQGWGRIIQISSAIAIHQPPRFPDYQAAKAAEVNMTRSLARALAGTGVTANAISAGIIHTPGSENELTGIARHTGLGEDWRAQERRLALEIFRQSVGRVGRGDDIAATVSFLASPAADFITGANIVVDGGI